MKKAPPEGSRSARAGKGQWIALAGFVAIALGASALTIRLYKAPHSETILLAYHFAALIPALFWYLRQQERQPSARMWKVNGLRGIAVVATLAFASSAILSFERAPGVLITDEQVYRFQARLLEAGMLEAAAPPGVMAGQELPPELRFHHNLIAPRGWTGIYPIVWPLLLALGDLAGAAWLVAPLLGAILVFLTAILGRISFGPQAGLLGAILMFPTPFFLINASGMMSHALAACLVVGALCLIESGIGAASASRICGAVALFALCFFVRPFTAVAAGGAAALVLTLRCAVAAQPGIDIPWLARRVLAPAVGIIAIAGLLGLLQNQFATGNALLSPYALSVGASTPPEISLDLHAIRAHLPETKNSLIVTVLHTAPFLFALAALAMVTRWRKQFGVCLLLASAFAGSVVLYAADLVPNVYFGGQRMYFEGLAGIAILAGAGAVWMIERFHVPARALLVCAALLASVQAAEIVNLNRDIRTRLRRTSGFLPYVEALQLNHAIVFMRPIMEPAAFEPRNFNLNAADWQHAPKIYLLDPGPERREAVTQAFHRTRWVVVAYHPLSDSFVIEATGDVPTAGA